MDGSVDNRSRESVTIDELSRELARARAENERLRQFVHLAAHDLVAPARAMRSLAQLVELELDGVMPTHLEHLTGMLDQRADALVRLIRDLAHYSTADRLDDDLDVVDADRLLRLVVTELDAPRSTMVVTTELPGPLVLTPASLRTCVRHLVDNARRHRSDPAGRVEVKASHDGHHLVVEVVDDGPGIRHDLLDRVFEPLQASDKLRTSGLGLALVRRLVDDHGGDLELRSITDVGTSITLRWPATVPAAST